MSTSQVSTLIDGVYRILSGLDSADVASFLKGWPERPYTLRQKEATSLPVLTYLPPLVSEEPAETAVLLNRLVQTAEHLAWGQTYNADDFGAAFLERYGWTELMGVRGPLANERLASGFLVLGPELEYPKHSHEAEEIYVPLTEAWWVRGDEAWETRPVGVPIVHRPWESHAMRTGERPLVALYLWRGGNLTQKSRID